MVFMQVLAVLRVDLEALKVSLHDEIDHPGDGIRSVRSRGAAGDHFDPLYQPCGYLVKVRGRLCDGRIGGTHPESAAVDQHQRASGSESAQIRGGDAARGRQSRAAVAEILAKVVIKVLREQIDEVRHIGLAIHLNVFRGDDLNRARAHFVRSGDARAGDDYLLQRLRFRGCCDGLRRRSSGGLGQHKSVRRNIDHLREGYRVDLRLLQGYPATRGESGSAQWHDGHGILVEVTVCQTRSCEQLVERFFGRDVSVRAKRAQIANGVG